MPKITGRRVSVAAAAVALGGVLLGDAPAATPTFASAASGATATAAQSLTISRPAGSGAGNVLVAAVAFRVDSATSIAAPVGWTTVVQTACTTASSPLAQATFVRVAGPSEPATYSFTGPATTGAVGSILAYSGVDTVQPVVAAAGAMTRNTRSLSASVTTSVPQSLLVGAFTHSGRTAIDPPTGMQPRTDAVTGTSAPAARMLTADQLLATAGTHSRTARAQANNTCNVAQLVALRPAPTPPANTALPIVSGTALEGQVLTATAGSWSNAPTSYAYSWERCSSSGDSCSPVGASATSYQLTTADVGSTVRVVVTASNSGGSASAASSVTAVVAPLAPPANVAAPAISGDAREAVTLSATTGAWTGSPSAYGFAWERCDGGGGSCVAIPSANGQTYVLTADDVGFTVRVVVMASNAAGTTAAASSPTAVVLPQPPASTAPPQISGIPRLGETLTATTGSWSGAPSSFAFQWERCDASGGGCAAVVNATADQYEVGGDDLGRTLRVVVTAANAGGSSSAASAPTTPVVPEPPTNLEPPTVSGTPRARETLTAAPGTWTGSPTVYSYRWQRSGDGGLTWSDTPGEAAAYVPMDEDVGFVLRVLVTASNAGGSAAAPSAATEAIAPSLPPANLDAPSILGTAQEGVELTATSGTWTGSPTAYALAWERCEQDGATCTPIADADGTTYTPSAADVGFRLRVVVSATNPSGSGTAVSAATAPVLRAPPQSLSPPEISGTMVEGQDLLATVGSWSGDPTAYAYLWHRCDTDGSACAPVTWATTADHRLREAEVGGTLRVQVSATNEGGTASVMSEATPVIVPLPPVNLTPPVVSGVLEQGEVVSATTGTWQSSGSLSYTYQWQRSGDGGTTWADVAGATAPTYVLASDDVGSVVRVVVTAGNAGGSASAASVATEAISDPGRPVNIGAPTYTGFVQAGRTVTADPGVWSGAPTAFAYQWQRSTDDGATWLDMPAATSPNYVLTTQDVGLALRVRVAATNGFGTTQAASPSASIHPAGNLVAAVNQQWRCTGPVNLDLVKLTLWTREADAVVFGNGCTGRLGRVEIDTWTWDALKTVNGSPARSSRPRHRVGLRRVPRPFSDHPPGRLAVDGRRSHHRAQLRLGLRRHERSARLRRRPGSRHREGGRGCHRADGHRRRAFRPDARRLAQLRDRRVAAEWDQELCDLPGPHRPGAVHEPRRRDRLRLRADRGVPARGSTLRVARRRDRLGPGKRSVRP